MGGYSASLSNHASNLSSLSPSGLCQRPRLGVCFPAQPQPEGALRATARRRLAQPSPKSDQPPRAIRQARWQAGSQWPGGSGRANHRGQASVQPQAASGVWARAQKARVTVGPRKSGGSRKYLAMPQRKANDLGRGHTVTVTVGHTLTASGTGDTASASARANAAHSGQLAGTAGNFRFASEPLDRPSLRLTG
jgi:hypothetical protein